MPHSLAGIGSMALLAGLKCGYLLRIEISNNDGHKMFGLECQVGDLNLRMSRIFSMFPELGLFLPTNLSWFLFSLSLY